MTDIQDKFDLDMNGDITDTELKNKTLIIELQLREEKANAQKKMSWLSLLSMIVFTIFLFVPFIPDNRISALGDVLGIFYIAQASIVGFYFGASAYMSRK